MIWLISKNVAIKLSKTDKLVEINHFRILTVYEIHDITGRICLIIYWTFYAVTYMGRK